MNGAVSGMIEDDGATLVNALDSMLPFCELGPGRLEDEVFVTGPAWSGSLHMENVPLRSSIKWMPSKRPTQNVKNDGSFSLLAFACHLDCWTCHRVKDQKIGEGTYAVVYRGVSFACTLAHPLIPHQ